MKIKYIAIFCALLIIEISNIYGQKNIERKLELPKIVKNEEVICHTYYCFVYNEEHEQAKWVAYHLTDKMVNGDEPRDDNFKSDPAVSTGTAELSDYKSSGYDRGHLAPAADMSITKTSMEESFFFSNISPQLPGFNRGLWKSLESSVRDFAKNLKSIYVVTGPLLKPYLPVIGKNEVSVPQEFFKAILFISDTLISEIAFIMPNKKLNNQSIFKYAVSIDELEKRADIDLFPSLPYFLEKKTEKQCDTIFWQHFSN